MQINFTFLYYTLAMGILMSLNTYGFTMLRINPIIALFWEFLIILLFQSVWVFFNGESIFGQKVFFDLRWIILMAITATLSSYIFARGFQSHGFNPAAFSLANTLISSIILVAIGYFLLKSNLNYLNMSGLILGIISIYLLNIK